MDLTMKKTFVLIIAFLIICSSGIQGVGSKKILIAYFSKTGYTKQMAEAVAEGAGGIKNIKVKLRSVNETKLSDVLQADAIILGTPVYNANIALPMQEFINKWPINNPLMKNKIGAAFVSAGGISSGEELAMMNIIQSMLIYNMIIIGGNDWKSPFGASAITEEPPFDKTLINKKVNPYFLKKAKNLGERVARVVVQFERPKNIQKHDK